MREAQADQILVRAGAMSPETMARRHGVEIGGLRARQVTAADFHRFDHIIALDHRNLTDLERLRPDDSTAALSLLLDHVPGRRGQAVTDPWFGDEAGFDVTWAEVTAAARGLVARFTTSDD